MNQTKRFLTATCLLLFLLFFAGGLPTHAGDDWLPISPEDLALKDNPANPGAHAMILYRGSDVDSKESWVKEYIRVKIFTQEATKEGDIEIPFVKGNSDIKDIHARTIHPDGSIVNFEGKVFDKTIVKASGVKVLAKTFTLPDVQPGCIIEYQYREQSNPDLLYNESWIVSSHLFTRDAHFSFKPYIGPSPVSFRQFGLPPTTVPKLQKDGSYLMDIHNIAGIEDEQFMPPVSFLEIRVEFFYRNVHDPTDETPEQYWNRMGKSWGENIDRFINKKDALANDLRSIVNPNDPPELKLQKIYARTQKIRNLSGENSKTEKEEKQEQLKTNANVEDVLKRSYGYSRQINETFVGLARAAGFEAALVYIAPRNHNFFFIKMKDSSQLGDDIVWVQAGSKEYYLDPAAIGYPFRLLPWYETSTDGVRVMKEGGKIIKTPQPSVADASVVRRADLEMDDDGLASGKLELDFTGQWSAEWRDYYRNEDETGRKKSIEDKIKEWLPAGSSFEITKISDWDNNTVPLHVEGAAKIPNFGTPAGHRMLATATVFKAIQATAFEAQKRVNPIFFNYPFEEVDTVKLHGPANYRIETIPAANQLKPGSLVYEISATQQNDSVEVKRHLVVGGIFFNANIYVALRQFFNTVKTNDDAQIVFQNGESAKSN